MLCAAPRALPFLVVQCSFPFAHRSRAPVRGHQDNHHLAHAAHLLHKCTGCRSPAQVRCCWLVPVVWDVTNAQCDRTLTHTHLVPVATNGTNAPSGARQPALHSLTASQHPSHRTRRQAGLAREAACTHGARRLTAADEVRACGTVLCRGRSSFPARDFPVVPRRVAHCRCRWELHFRRCCSAHRDRRRRTVGSHVGACRRCHSTAGPRPPCALVTTLVPYDLGADIPQLTVSNPFWRVPTHAATHAGAHAHAHSHAGACRGTWQAIHPPGVV